jgi:AcrR family transcriptional regulator
MAGKRRAQLLTLAAKMISESGYHAVGMDDIGEAAGISGPALYKHFRGKQEILGEILIEPTERLDRGARRVVANADSPQAALDALVEWHTTFTARGINVVRIYYSCLQEMAPVDREVLEKKLDAYIAIWIEQIRAVRPDIRLTSARAVVMALFRLFNVPHAERAAHSREDLIGVMAKASLHAVLNRPGTPKRAAS